MWALLFAVAAGAGDAPTRIMVLPTSMDAAARAEVPEGLDAVILDSVRRAGDFEVTGREDILAVLDYEQQKQLLGCEDTFCMTELVGAMGAEQLVATRLDKVDDAWLLAIKRLDARDAKVHNRVNKLVRGDVQSILRVVPAVVAELFGVEEMEGVDTVVAISPAAASIVNAHLDLGGALLWGPALGIEMGKQVAATLRVRALNAGLATALLVNDADRHESLQLGLGAGVAARWYFSREGNMRGPYVGVGAEYWYAKVVDQHFDREAYITHALLSQLEAGYRFTFGRLLVSPGGWLGYMTVLDARTEDLSGGEDRLLYEADAKDRFSVGLSAEIGYFF